MEYNGIKEERRRFTKKPGDVSKSLGGTAITIRKRSERHSRWGRVPRQPRVETTENEGRKRERKRATAKDNVSKNKKRCTIAVESIRGSASVRWTTIKRIAHSSESHPSLIFFFFFKEGPFFSGEKGSRNVPVFLSTFNFHHAFIARRITNSPPRITFTPWPGVFDC